MFIDTLAFACRVLELKQPFEDQLPPTTQQVVVNLGDSILIGVKLTLVGSPLLYSDSLTESG